MHVLEPLAPLLKYTDIFSPFGQIMYAILIVEFLCSMYWKDGIYSFFGTIGNTINGFVAKFFSLWFIATATGYYVLWHMDHLSLFPTHAITPVSFIICLILVDFFYYLFHLMHHTFDFFWMFHAAHHGDNKLNLSTALRVSWMEQFYIILFFIPVVLLGFSAKEVILAYFTLSLYQFFCHGQYLQLPRFFDYVMVTPHNHSIHHDQEYKNHNSNFGGTFSIWDRFFGTYTEDVEHFVPGLKGYQQDNTFLIQADPIAAYIKKLFTK